MSRMNLDWLEQRLPFAVKVEDRIDWRKNALFQRLMERANEKGLSLFVPHEVDVNGFASVTTHYEQYAVAVAAPHVASGQPARVLLASGKSDKMHTFGVIEGVQFYPRPFVGMIETMPEHQRLGKAARMLGVMNVVSQAVYEMPLTSGPESYLSENGRALAEFMLHRYGLEQDDQHIISAPEPYPILV